MDNIVDQASATMRMKAMFANEDEQLWPEISSAKRPGY
jgi:hypothetical protein